MDLRILFAVLMCIGTSVLIVDAINWRRKRNEYKKRNSYMAALIKLFQERLESLGVDALEIGSMKREAADHPMIDDED